MSHQRTSTFSNNVGVGDVILVGGINKRVDTIIDILLYRIVNRTLTIRRTCAVIVYSESSSTVNEVDIIAHFVQLNIELGRFSQCSLNATNLRYLRAYMKVDEP